MSTWKLPNFHLVECREFLILGTKTTMFQRLANKLLVMQAMCVMNRKQEGIKKFFPVVVEGHVEQSASNLLAMLAKKDVVALCVLIHLITFVKDNDMHA